MGEGRDAGSRFCACSPCLESPDSAASNYPASLSSRAQSSDHDRAEFGARDRVGSGPHCGRHSTGTELERNIVSASSVRPANGCRYNAAGTFQPSDVLPVQGRLRLLQHSRRRTPLPECRIDLRDALCGCRCDQGPRCLLPGSCRRDKGTPRGLVGEPIQSGLFRPSRERPRRPRRQMLMPHETETAKPNPRRQSITNREKGPAPAARQDSVRSAKSHARRLRAARPRR